MGSKLSKKQQKIRAALKPNHLYSAEEAIKVLKDFASKNFVEGIDMSFNLGVDVRKPDQAIRSQTVLPNGTGKKVRVAVFAQGDKATMAKNAGADHVGFEDLAAAIKGGMLDFDVVIATPDSMRFVGQLGPILGPRNLMPNPKNGTVTLDVEKAVSDAKGGQVRYRTDKNGIIHCPIGKVDFPVEHLLENMGTLVADLRKAKPLSSKGVYFRKISLSSTMGPGLSIDISSISV